MLHDYITTHKRDLIIYTQHYAQSRGLILLDFWASRDPKLDATLLVANIRLLGGHGGHAIQVRNYVSNLMLTNASDPKHIVLRTVEHMVHQAEVQLKPYPGTYGQMFPLQYTQSIDATWIESSQEDQEVEEQEEYVIWNLEDSNNET